VTDRWALTLAGLLGGPWPMPADLPGRVIVRPWPADDGPSDAELQPFTDFISARQPLADRLQAAADRRKADRKAQQMADRTPRGPARKPARRGAGKTTSAGTAQKESHD
jgi:hypothetical protein